MSLPEALTAALASELGPIVGVRPVGGGCIHPAVRLETAEGLVFVKYGGRSSHDVFAVEAAGLEALRSAAHELRVPAVVSCSQPGSGEVAWLALEWMEAGPSSSGCAERLGRGLARLHGVRRREWGWERDGYIGPLPQPNAVALSWAEFWWSRRLEPQLALAERSACLPGTRAEWDRLASRLDDLLAFAEADGASLLHGDLWGGNVIALASGEPALVDPAVYRGHREVDLAMTELFGGFAPRFYAAYRETWPLAAGYTEVRRYVYQLYYLLVHVNLFGGGYLGQTAAMLRRVLQGT
jgi:protein-ribulosamine 3-kinase